MSHDALYADVAADAPGCVAAVVTAGRVAWHGCFGLAETTRGEPLTAQHRFRIASITKPMAAFVALALADAGRLDFGDSSARWLPEAHWPASPTVSELLSMKSGLYDVSPLAWLAGSDRGLGDLALDAQLALLFAQREKAFAPGTRTLYANGNYLLLQLIFERASGKRFADLLRAYVFEPAGMATAALHDGALPPGMGRSHVRDGDGWTAIDGRGQFGAAGAVIASLDDMTAWCRWTATDPRGWRGRLAGPVTHADGSPSGYAHGVQRQRLAGEPILGHAGNIDGWSGEWLHAPARDTSVVILGNRADLNWFERSRELLSDALGLAPDPAMTPRRTGQRPAPLWSAVYASADPAMSLTVEGGPGELSMEGRRLPQRADGSFARNLGVEPIKLDPDGPLETPPPCIVRGEGNQRVVLTRVDPVLSPPLPDGDYTHPDLPFPLRIRSDADGPYAEAGPKWPPPARWALRHLAGGLWRAYGEAGAPLDLHVRFEADAVVCAFARLPGLQLTRTAADNDDDEPRLAAASVAQAMKRVALLALALAACMPAADPAERATTLTIAKAFAPAGLDPAVSATAGETTVLDLVYEQLTRLDPASPVAEPVGELAESWQVAQGGRSIGMQLRAGHMFADGRPVDAAAVKASLDRLIRLGRAPSGLYDWLGGVTVTGPLGIRIDLKRPFGPALQLLSLPGASIVSPAALARPDALDWLAEHSAGSGRYVVERVQPGEAVTLVANPRCAPPRQFTRIVLRAIPDEGVRRLLLERGDIDLTDIVPAALVDRYRALPNVSVVTRGGGASVSLLLINARTGSLADVRLRRAVALAIDYDSLRRLILKGNAVQPAGYLPPGAPGRVEGEVPRRDLTGARVLVQVAGYRDAPIVLLVSQLGPVAEFLQANLREAGLNVRIERRSPGAMQALQASGDFGLIYSGWGNDTPDPGPMLSALYGTAGIAAGTNASGIADPRTDALIAAALASPDVATRARLYAAADTRLRASVPAIVLFAANPVIAYRRDLAGVAIDRWQPVLLDAAALSRESVP